MKPLALLVLVLCSFVVVAPSRAADSKEVQWRRWDAGLKQSAATNRPVLVDVYTQWCGWCKRMDRDVYSRNDVREYLGKRFVTVRLDAEAPDGALYDGKSYTEQSLASFFRVTGYPTTVFLRPSGEHLVNVPGYVPADRFLPLLRYIGDGYYDQGVSFDDFVKSTPESARKK